MGLGVRALTKFSLSNIGQKFYKVVCDPKNETFLNNTLPSIETIITTSCYVYATARRKEIPERQRDMLQTQNILSGVGGFILGSYANRKISNYAKTIIPHIDPKVVPDVEKVVGGLKVGLPILTTAILMRCIVPSVIAWISGKNEDRKAQNKLDEQA